jgi:NADH-quinone oxidoreductase subunit L
VDTTSTYSIFFTNCLGLALALPLLSFLISALIRDQYAWLASIISPLLMIISALCALSAGVTVWNEVPFIVSWSWFSIGNYELGAGILLNNLSALMLMVVTGISLLVHLYSVGYMAGDAGSRRYFAMLGLFTFSMLGIVVSDNLLLIFVFWELVGFSSFMLIGHWQQKPEAAAAAKKAFILNRVGDAGFLIGLMIIWTNTNTFSIASLEGFAAAPWYLVASLCLFAGVVGKSAQFPLLSWLPDAMEGPTPVSALIHAATMVAAGVFLLARMHFLFPAESLMVVACVGILTSLMGALAALVQTDIKKILAYSTISQLGFMVTATGVGAPEAAMLHLFTHAFFKACLFLCAGSIIHVLHHAQHHQHVHFDVQDIRNMGGLRKKLPFTFIAMMVSGGALAGLPLSAGFLSKEAIFSAINSWRGGSFNIKWIIFALAFVITGLTVLYTFRLIAKVFLGEETATRHLSLTEPPTIMRLPVAVLAFGSLWFVVSGNPFDFSGWLSVTSPAHSMLLTFISVFWIIGALLFAFLLFRKNLWPSSSFLKENFYIDYIYSQAIVKPVVIISAVSDKTDRRVIDRVIHSAAYLHVLFSHFIGWFDRAIVDGLVNGFGYLARLLGSFTRSFQGGKIQLYVFWTIFAIIIFLIWSLI